MTEAVLAANRRYYEAFEAKDMDAMSDLWEHSDRVGCTHPGWARLEGWGPVAASFFALFQGGQQIQFILTRERVTSSGDVAWVSLDGTSSAIRAASRSRPSTSSPARGGPTGGGWCVITVR